MYSYVKSPLTLFGESEQELLEKAVKLDHPFRQLNRLVNFDKTARSYRNVYSSLGSKGVPIEKAFRCLLVQWLEDYSDREMERALEENMAVKWFCGYDISEETPDHSFFGKFRQRLGTKNLGDIFKYLNKALKAKGLVGEVFSFIDATGIVTKTALWAERDKALALGEEKLNNQNVTKYAADKQARYGCKGKDQYWFGYKRHHCVDMKQGIITKVAITPAHLNDDKALKHVVPEHGMGFLDKGYDTAEGHRVLAAHGIQPGIILKKNRKEKNQDKDSFISKLRMPYEGTFSKLHRRAKYRGIAKVQFQAFGEAIAHNLKRMLTLVALEPVYSGWIQGWIVSQEY